MVGFDNGDETEITLDGNRVNQINADLSGDVDTTLSSSLLENLNLGFIGVQKGGDFDIEGKLARIMIEDNPQNSTIVQRLSGWINFFYTTAS